MFSKEEVKDAMSLVLADMLERDANSCKFTCDDGRIKVVLNISIESISCDGKKIYSEKETDEYDGMGKETSKNTNE